jgi:hypothetical protein
MKENRDVITHWDPEFQIAFFLVEVELGRQKEEKSRQRKDNQEKPGHAPPPARIKSPS